MTSDTLHGPGDIILDRYELIRLLGSGGWGRVYLANDRMLHRPVAIKQLLPRLAADPAAVSRFLREASVMASIREPHVLTIHDIAERDGQHYMVMEYADAGTLAQQLQLEGTLSPYEALTVGIDVCRGLRAIHSKAVVHRDVKPANVMFFSRTDGLPVAKIGDFGIALQPQEERLTPSDNVVGTLIYLSPEQASSSPHITPVADLYSLGVVLYEMMSGELQEPLFVNPIFASANTSEVIQHLGVFPDPVRPLLVKALHRNSEDRFQSADEMLQALQRARSRLTVSFATQTFEQVTTEESLSPTQKARFPARLVAVAGGTLALLAVGAVVGLGLVFSGTVAPTPEPEPTLAVVSSIPTPTVTVTHTPTPTALPSLTPTPTPSPSGEPSSSPSPTVTPEAAISTQVSGPASLTLLFRDSYNSPQGIHQVGNPSDPPAVYLEDSYLYGEVVTKIGETEFRIVRPEPNPQDPMQRLPSGLQLRIEYSGALKAAMQDRGEMANYDPKTGEFWVGRFRCGSAVPAESSPYRISVRLLEDDREIASRRYVIGVLNNPACTEGDDDDSDGPPTSR